MSRRRGGLAVGIAAGLAVVFAAAAICQTLRLRAMGRQVDALTARTADQQQQLDSLQQQLAEAQAAREAAEAEAQAALRSAELARAAEAKADIADGDQIGRVWVEGTQVDCPLYWGDTGSQFRNGAGAHSTDARTAPCLWAATPTAGLWT